MVNLERRRGERRSGRNRRVHTTWATEILHQSHMRMIDLFDDFDDPHESSRLQEICDLAINELRLHRALVEEVFLTAVAAAGADPAIGQSMTAEFARWGDLIAAVEHQHPDDQSFMQAWNDLRDAVHRHVERGEEALERVAAKLPLDFVALGLRMLSFRDQLLSEKPDLPE